MDPISLGKSNNPLTRNDAPIPIAAWELPSCQITLVGQEALKGIVEDGETGLSYTTEVRSPFKSAAQVPATVKRDFYAKVVSSQGIPVAVELCPRGMGGGKFYTQPVVPLQPLFQKASLNRDPKTPQELVSVLKQIPAGDQRLTRYLGFGSQFIKTFSANPTLMKDQIDGLVTLVLSENQDITHSVINELTKRIRNNTLLNLDLVHGLAEAIDRANPAHLNADDLVQIMFTIVERIAKTHTKGAEKSQEEQLRALIRVLNAMVDANVCDLSRERQEDINKLLGKFSDSDSIGVKCLSNYAKEALTRVPNDETKLAAFFRVSVGLAKGVYFFYAAINQIDPGKLVDGFFALQKSAQGILMFAKQIKDGFLDALPDALSNAQDSFLSIKEGTSSLRLRKLEWYDQIRYVEMLIASNAFQALEALLLNPSLQKRTVFFYAIIERLHEVIVSHPNLNVRRETLQLLQSLYQDDKTWNKRTFKKDHYKNEGPTKLELTNRGSIRKWMGIKGAIISHLTSYQQVPELQGYAAEALGMLTQSAQSEERAFISRYQDTAPKIISPMLTHTPLFTPKAKEQIALEAKIEKAKALVVEDQGFQQEKRLYVPLMGSPYAGGRTTFDLLEEVQKFLRGDQKVLLLLGPSGSGKSFFSQVLAEIIWKDYQPGTGLIPLYVSLPSVKNPSQELLSETFKRLGLNNEEIMDLKSRELVFILDGYDELPLYTQLLKQNAFSDFKVKIIVTSRTEAIPSNDLFIPTVVDKPKKSLLKEIYLAPFSSSQMNHFIQRCIDLGNTEWKSVSQYRQRIDEISGLLELVQNPFILKIITDTLPEIIDRYKQTSSADRLTVTRYALYEAFIDEWFQKGVTRAPFTELKSVGLTPKNLKKEALAFCVQLAYAFRTQGSTHVQYTPESRDPKWEPWLGDHPKAAYIRTMVPLKITSDGDHSFLHKSILEYFIAQGSKTTITQTKTMPSSLKGVPIFSTLLEPSEWFFLADEAKSDASFKQELWELIEKSKTDPQMAIAAANAASIWNLADFSFSRRDLRNARLPGAYLERAIFWGADLRGADLTHATLSGAVLSYALLDSAKMEGVKFGQWPFIKTKLEVRALASSPDGKQTFGGGDYNAICIWDTVSGRLIKELMGHLDRVNVLSLLDGGKKLVSGSDDRTIRIWDLETGEEIQKLKGHTSPVKALTLFNDGKKLASGSYGELFIWDTESGQELKRLEGHLGFVNALTLLEGGKKLAAGSFSRINIWDLESGKMLKVLERYKGQIEALISLEGGKILFSRGNDSTIYIWDLDSDDELKILEGHKSYVTALTLLEGGKKLASGSMDKTIRIWDLETGKELTKFEGYTGIVRALTLLDDGKKLASASDDNTIRIWDLNVGEELKKSGHEPLGGGNQIVSEMDHGVIRIQDLAASKLLRELEGRIDSIEALTFLEGGKKLALGSFSEESEISEITIWDLESGKELKKLEGHQGSFEVMTLLAGGKNLALGSKAGIIHIWDLDSGKVLKNLDGHTDSVIALVFLPGDKKLASASLDYTIRIWDLAAGKELKKLEGHSSNITVLIPLEGGKKLASGSNDGTIRIWDLETGKELKKLEGHEGWVKALIPLEGGKILVLDDGIIRIWDTESGEKLEELENRCDAMALLPGGKKLASGGNNAIRIWDLDTDKQLLKISCPFLIESLAFMEPNLLLAGNDDGIIWCWQLNFQEKDLRPELLWVTNPTLTCSKTRLGNPIDLSEPNQRLLLQHGATSEK